MDASATQLRRSKFGRYASHLFPVLIALTAGQGMVKAASLGVYATSNGTLQITNGTVSLACSTSTGPTTQTIYVKPVTALTGTYSNTVTMTTISGTGPSNVTVTAVGSNVLTSSNPFITYTVAIAPSAALNCAG